MKCQKCNESIATIHLTEIVEGQRSETHLCQTCAQDEGVALKSQIPLNELLNSLLASEVVEKQAPPTEDDLNECPCCGMTWEKFRKQPSLGCANDYQLFAKKLEPIIKKAHCGNTQHIGKVPTKTDITTQKQISLLTLRKQLEQAIKQEDYEAAARLRDKINNFDF